MRLILGPIPGAVTNDSAKVWIFWSKSQDDEPAPKCHIYKNKECTEKISSSPFDDVSTSVHTSGAIHGLSGLAHISFPGEERKYYFKIKSGLKNDPEDERIYAIRPFPKDASCIDSLSFALVSCHRPIFKPKVDEKRVSAMWKQLGDRMHEHGCRFLINAGDQVYSDYPALNAWEHSLKESSDEKKLWYYRQLYLKYWDFPEVQEVMRSFPQYMIWDDHEITNGWGSEHRHYGDNRYRRVFEIARQAYIEFQHCHNPNPLREGEFYFAFNYGPVAFLFMDLRGHRNIALYDPKADNGSYPLAGKEQWDDIQKWLNSKVIKESKALFVITSVPVCHLSRKFWSFGFIKNDIFDQWSTPHNKKERRILLGSLLKWSGDKNKPVFLLSGDVHVGTVGKITEKTGGDGNSIHQITSSPITNDPASLLDIFMKRFSGEFNFHLEKGKKRPMHGKITHRYRKRNFAIIKVQLNDINPNVYLYMYEGGKRKPDPVSFI
ncbi:MAG: alkaline phosphatase family protein [Fidelibacterota bacterium]|nr:MAG: alkaline phosphatase family protein [Candidatus Neomarinimicrobiota bacterium]